MKPVAIFRHAPSEGPGYFSDFLDEAGIPWILVRIDQNDSLPDSAADFSGLAFMGGPMSVNDDLPWILRELELILQAVKLDLPVIGHCLGGQLMAKALGATVSANPVKEIGWGRVEVADSEAARKWFKAVRQFDAFHWHGETFGIPRGASAILSNEWCRNQGFSIGPHLAMQFHIEMTSQMVRSWCEIGRSEIAANPVESVQSGSEIMNDLEARIQGLRRIAQAVYAEWVRGLSHGD